MSCYHRPRCFRLSQNYAISSHFPTLEQLLKLYGSGKAIELAKTVNQKINFMDKKLLGIILSVLCISGLIWAVIYINIAVDSTHVNAFFAGGIAGAVAKRAFTCVESTAILI